MKKQDLLVILIPTLICVIAWIGFNIYDNSVTSTISPQEVSQIAPINPDFDRNTISALKQRERIEPFFQATPSSGIIPTPTPIVHVPVITNLKNLQATTEGKINK